MIKRVIVNVCTAILLAASFPAFSLSIALVVWRGETEAEKGFIEGLEALGYAVETTVYDAEQDKNTLSNIIRGKLTKNIDEYDYIYSFGTTVSKALKTHLAGKKPHVFNIVSFPATAGILPDEAGGQHNTAGVSSRVLTEDQVKSARAVLSLKRVAFAFNPREANSTMQLKKMVEIGKRYQFDVVPVRIRPQENLYLTDLRKVTEVKQLSAIYFPSDSFLISHAEEIMSFVNEKRIPSICAVSTYLKHGCFMGTVADYNKLGVLAASIIDKHVKGTALADIPVKFDSNPQPVINEDTKKLLQP